MPWVHPSFRRFLATRSSLVTHCCLSVAKRGEQKGINGAQRNELPSSLHSQDHPSRAREKSRFTGIHTLTQTPSNNHAAHTEMVMKRVRHPSGADILFDAKWHQYKLGGTKLLSVSKTLDRYFPFDEEKVLAIVSRKTQLPVAQIKAQWNRQALLGKNVHAYIESKLLQEPPPAFTLLMANAAAAAAAGKGGSPGVEPSSMALSELLHGEESTYLPVADAAVDRVLTGYEVLAVEQVIAAPDWGVAGTIDFVAVNRANPKKIMIGDWKTSGSVTSDFRFGSFQTPSMGCLRHLPNDKLFRYAMQVIIYGEIVKREKYFEKGFFDAAIAAAVARNRGVEGGAKGQEAENTEAAKAKGKKAKNKKQQKKGNGDASVGPLTVDLSALHRGDFELEYGIIQMSKDEQGGVVAEFKEVTEGTVLPADSSDTDFTALLKRVMAGE